MQKRYSKSKSRKGLMRNETVLVVGGHIANFDLYKLQVKGVWLSIEKELMGVLKCLVEAYGDVVSKAKLNSYVWPGDELSDAELITKIEQLKKILECNGELPSYIKTVPGEGYQLIKNVLSLQHA